MSMLQRVDVEDFLTALGIDIAGRSGSNLLFLCPFHHERHPSARMDSETTAWLCSVGCGKGNAIHFLSQLRGMDFNEARDHIYARYGIGPGAAIDDLESEVRRNLGLDVKQVRAWVPPDESWVSYLAVDWEVDREHPAALYMNGRGFTAEELTRWKIGFDTLSQRVSIPVRDHIGTLVGFKGRAIDPERQPRYLILGDHRPDEQRRYDFDTYKKSEYVFGLDRCILAGARSITLVEGELNAIAMWERHGEPAGAAAGSDFTDRQRELVCRYFDHVTIYGDDDGWRCTKERHYRGDEPGPCQVCGAETFNPGVKGTAKMASMLTAFIDVSVVLNPPGDAAELDTDIVGRLLRNAEPSMELAVRGKLDLQLTT